MLRLTPSRPWRRSSGFSARLQEPDAFEIPGPQALTLHHLETGPIAECCRSPVSPARLKVVKQEQRPAGPDDAVDLSQSGGAVVHIADCQSADHGLERVLAEREPVTVGDSQAHGPTQLMSTHSRDAEMLPVKVHCD